MVLDARPRSAVETHTYRAARLDVAIAEASHGSAGRQAVIVGQGFCWPVPLATALVRVVSLGRGMRRRDKEFDKLRINGIIPVQF